MYLSQLFEYQFDGRPMIRRDIKKAAANYASSVTANTKYDRTQYYIFGDKLKKYGWKLLGEGAASGVWLHPRIDKVLKINIFPDSAYDEFVKIIHDHPNIHFPVIYDASEILKGKYPFKAYFMEKLIPVSLVNSDSIAAAINNVAKYHDKSIEELLERPSLWSLRDYLEELPDDLLEAARIVGRCANNKTGRIDIHYQNIMRRKDGTIVIIDPYYNEYETEFKLGGNV